MLLTYNKTNVLNIPLVNEKTRARESGIMLVPGTNDVRGADWDRVKEFPKIKRLIELDDIRIESENESTDDKSAIAEMPVKDVQRIVKGTFDIRLLNDWLGSDTRAGVVRAINKQLAEIEQKTKKKAANED